MQIENSGPTITLLDIVPIEDELGAALPNSYRKFLLDTNGGVPTPDTIDVPGLEGSPTDVQVFFGIGRLIESSNLGWNLELVAERCSGRSILPIACDSGGNLFCLEFKRDVEASVVYCNLEDPVCRLVEVSSTFDSFVASIRPFES